MAILCRAYCDPRAPAPTTLLEPRVVSVSMPSFHDLFPAVDPMSREEELELVRKMKAGDKAAEEKLVRQWGRYAVGRCLSRYPIHGATADWEELAGWALLGLVWGLQHYDETRGTRLSTCLSVWIDFALQKGQATARFIKMPCSIESMSRRVAAAERELATGASEDVSSQQIADYINADRIAASRKKNKKAPKPVTPATVDRLREILHSTTVLHWGTAMSHPWGERLTTPCISPVQVTGEEESETQEVLDVRSALGVLTERERTIIRHRFGFEDRVYTLEELGQKLGVTRERVRQIETEALAKVRSYLGAEETCEARAV